MPYLLRRALSILALVLFATTAARDVAAQANVLISAGVDQVGYIEGLSSGTFPGAPVYWSTTPTCSSGPIGAGLPGVAPGAPGEELLPALLTRGGLNGPIPRRIFDFNPPRALGVCNPYKLMSNLAVDETHIYYVDNQGPGGNYAIWRRARDANPADASQLLRDLLVSGTTLSGAELIVFGPYLFAILHGGFDVLAEYFKETGGLIDPSVRLALSLRDMKFDGKYLYWIEDGNLVANDTTNGVVTTVATGVSTYITYAQDENCSPLGCEPFAFVIYAESNGPPTGNRIFTKEHVSGFTDLDYTAPPNTSIYGLTYGAQRLFFFTRGPAPFGGPFDREERLLRLLYPSGGAGALVYGPFLNSTGYDSVVADFGNLVYFRERATGRLLSLPQDAAEIPVRQLRATGLEITQGIQNPNNDVSLIEGKRTFARFYVTSDGPTDVPGVTAALDVTGPNGYIGRLEPVNGVNKQLNVLRTPVRRNLGDSFLFELPIEWTRNAYLIFSALVNPNRAIIEDVYTNNSSQTPILILSESPRLPLETISWWYLVGNNLITGNTFDNFRSEWHLRNVYPLAYESGGIAQPGPGLRTASRVILDNELVDQVDRTDANCVRMRGPTATKPADDRNQCAGDYVMGQVRAMKAAGTLPNDRYYYSSIAGNATTLFTRGYALTGERSACGPMTDPSPQQNYMAHEVGHLLGRDHPGTGAAPICPAQDAADPGYPFPRARIGNSTTVAADETVHMGIDPGDFTTSPKTLRPASTTGDVMSYCRPYGVSNYTFNAMWLWMSITNPVGAALPRAAGVPLAAAIPGDWLLVYGTVSPEAAALASVKRLPSVMEVPVLVAGGYKLELRNAGGALLASHPFTPEVIDDGPPGFGAVSLVVPFAVGTRELRIVKGASTVLLTHPVSANPPRVDSVAIAGSPDPVEGTVTVVWDPVDPDGDPMTFDLHYSFDDGVTWRPVELAIFGSETEVDTSVLPGGTGRFRIEASDGAQTARGETGPFQVPRKPARVSIDSPADGTHVEWGQLVNFVASVDDVQGGVIPDQSITWTNAYRTLGIGPVLSVTDLEVGENLVTVSVIDAGGLPTFATVTVLVGDEVQPPGPRLSASPSPLAWQVPGDSSAVVQSDLQVRNAGGGSLTFRATSNQPWLLLNGQASVTTGALATLSVTADASGLPDAAVSEAEILLENLSSAGDSIVVKATVAKGDLVGGETFSDQDVDGVDDRADDCILVADGPFLPGEPGTDQRDTDGDGFGNACDADLNNDGIVNFADLARMKQVFFGSDAEADMNGDGVVNFLDLARMKAGFFQAPGPSAKAF